MSEHLRATADSLKRAQDALDAARIARAARESELASARIESLYQPAYFCRSGAPILIEL